LLAVALSLAAPALASLPEVGGKAYFVQNAATGEILLERNAEQRRPIASITKVMTVLVVLEHTQLDEVVTVGRAAPSRPGSTIHLRPGERLTVRELIEATLIQSANDAATALAEHVGRGDVGRFVSLMNAKAAELELTDTRFANPDGLDTPGHYSSARDVTRLARVAMRNPVVRTVVGRRQARISGGRLLHTWNDLLGTFPRVIGVKTGHTSGAGWSQVAAARGRGVTIYATLLGEPTRAQRNADLARLLQYGLSRYVSVPVIEQKQVYASAAVPWGKPALLLVAARSLVRVVRLGIPLVERVVAPTVVSLPVRKGQRLGEVRVYRGTRMIARSPLIASRSIDRPGWLGRVGWYSGRAWDTMWGWVS
jgi:D-alanyl-D-alanine carboxypeptidase